MKLFRPHVYHRRNILLLFALFIIALISRFYYQADQLQTLQSQLSSYFHSLCAGSTFWRSFSQTLVAAKPDCGKPNLSHKAGALNRFHAGWQTDESKNRIEMLGEDVVSMRYSHSLFLEMLETRAPKLEYTKGTKGTVTSAGGDYFPVPVVSLLMLRRTGSTLPVEVLVASEEEYEPQICEVVYPALNAKCIVLSRILQRSRNSIPLSGYQLKIFAILFSSFDDVLFLDADNFPCNHPNPSFPRSRIYPHTSFSGPISGLRHFPPILVKLQVSPPSSCKADRRQTRDKSSCRNPRMRKRLCWLHTTTHTGIGTTLYKPKAARDKRIKKLLLLRPW